MSEELKYLEIDAQAGLADINLTVGNADIINIVVQDSGLGGSGGGTGLTLGVTHDKAYYGDLGKIAYEHSQSVHAVPGEPEFNGWLNTNPLANFITDVPLDNNLYGRRNKQWAMIPSSYVTSVSVRKDDQFPIHYLDYQINNQSVTVTDIPKANGVIFGGYVNWIEGLTFSVNSTAYYIGGDLYTITTSSNITLSDADTTYPRIDIIIVNTDSVVDVITGIPSENPQKPTPDPLTEIELTQVLIPANATEPADITTHIIYDENIEWIGSYNGTTVDFNSTENFFKGTKGVNVTNIGNANTIAFTSVTPVAVAEYDYFVMYINLKAEMSTRESLMISFLSGNTLVSATTELAIAKSQTDSWQVINIPLAGQQFTQSTFDKVQIEWKNKQTTVHSGFYFDFVKLEKGITQYLQINETDPIFTAWKNAAYGGGAKATGVDAGSLFDMSLTDDYLYICVQGGIAGTAIWKKIAMTQT